MKRYTVIATGLYRESLKNLLDYINRQFNSPITADKHKKMFNQALFSLETMAESFQIIDDDRFRHLKLRKINVKKYKIIFYVDEKNSTVYVLGILHSSMDWLNHLNKQIFSDWD